MAKRRFSASVIASTPLEQSQSYPRYSYLRSFRRLSIISRNSSGPLRSLVLRRSCSYCEAEGSARRSRCLLATAAAFDRDRASPSSISRRTPSERVSPLRAAHASRRAVISADSRKAIKGVFPVGFRPGFPFFFVAVMKVLYIFEICEASGPLRRRHISSELSSTIAQVEQDRDRDSHFDKDDRHLDKTSMRYAAKGSIRSQRCSHRHRLRFLALPLRRI